MSWRLLRSGIIGGIKAFKGGNQTADSIYDLLQVMNEGALDMPSPEAGGILTINGESLGSYDYVIKTGNQTISSFTAANWFTNTEDSRSAFIVVKGNLTIDAGQILTPSVRKLFTAIYVTGNLIVNGEISMTKRGANHSSTGSNISSADIRIANGTFGFITDPQIPATGAPGGSGEGTGGQHGDDGLLGQTAGGGAGSGTSVGGEAGGGSSGSAFSGGTGGGGCQTSSGTGEDGATDGGKGGDAGTEGANDKGGGAGNPGGSGEGGGGNGEDGTGGTLIVICEGEYSGSGEVTSAGAEGGNNGSSRPGGGSGGGSVTVLAGSNDNGPTPTALGGDSDGAGGNGTARVLPTEPITDVSLISATTATGEDSSMAVPVGAQVGDVLLLLHTRDGADNIGMSSGFTEIFDETDGAPSASLGYRVLTDPVPSSINRPSGAQSEFGGTSICACFRNVDNANPLDVTSTQDDGGSGMPNPPAITPANDGSMIVTFGALDDDIVTMTHPSGMTGIAAINSGSSGSGASAAASYILQETAEAYNPGVYGGGASDEWHSFTTALRKG